MNKSSETLARKCRPAAVCRSDSRISSWNAIIEDRGIGGAWRRYPLDCLPLPAAAACKIYGCCRLVASHDVAAVACFASASTRQVGLDAVLSIAAAPAGVRGWPPRLGPDTVVQRSGEAATWRRCNGPLQRRVLSGGCTESSPWWWSSNIGARMWSGVAWRRVGGRTEETRWSRWRRQAHVSFWVSFNFVRIFPFLFPSILCLCFFWWFTFPFEWSHATGSQGERTPRLHQTNVAPKKMSFFCSF